MYPARFEYFAPSSVDEALEILERYGDEGKVLAGGQSLIPLMKLRFASPRALVDINRIEGLDHRQQNGALSIGALVRHKDCERSDALRGRYGVLGDAAPQISDPIVRNRGTVVGSLTHADPAGRLGLGAAWRRAPSSRSSRRAATRRSGSTSSSRARSRRACSRTRSPRRSRCPIPGASAGGTYLKLERKVGDYATVGVAVHLSFDNGTVGRAGIALTGVGPRTCGLSRRGGTHRRRAERRHDQGGG